MHSVVGWFAFAAWGDGRLLRSLSLSPDSGIIENGGEPLPLRTGSGAAQGHQTTEPGDPRPTTRDLDEHRPTHPLSGIA
ncbi:DUF6928 family protein [Streptomyces canus]|uniref:DUF6928 family protein n=1 Tax=Streptomyces canus TaxID=58343 RepID=UPI00386582A2